MAERLVISVDPGATEANQKVQDVFMLVLDLFDLLAHSGQSEDDTVAWKLVSVSMNSPLTIVAEAIAARPTPPAVIERVARNQKQRFSRNLGELKQGRVPDAWRSARETKRIERAFSAAQPATTRVLVADDNQVVVEEVVVLPADIPVVQRALSAAAQEALPRPKEQRGSIEGRIVEVGTFYNRPAIKIRERKTRADVWCTVTEAHRQEVSSATHFEDVWNGRRVRVEGLLQYDSAGDLSRVFVDNVLVVEVGELSAGSIADSSFTQGLTGAEYLDLFREGRLG